LVVLLVPVVVETRKPPALYAHTKIKPI